MIPINSNRISRSAGTTKQSVKHKVINLRPEHVKFLLNRLEAYRPDTTDEFVSYAEILKKLKGRAGRGGTGGAAATVSSAHI
jgi:hypothetical protein